MDPLLAYFLVLVALMVLTGAVLACVQRPLRAMTEEICGTANRALFWVRLFDATAFLFVFFCSMVAPPQRDGVDLGVFDLLATFRAGVFGLLFVLGVLGLVLLMGISSYERRQPRETRPLRQAAGGSLSASTGGRLVDPRDIGT